MGDRGSEWTGLRSLGVDVYPLVIARHLGEAIDHLLGDGDPVAGTEVGALVLRSPVSPAIVSTLLLSGSPPHADGLPGDERCIVTQ